jgi:2',3'-cyclic-nucleotide 2'-phosphodiesterase/3'-nucleotidase
LIAACEGRERDFSVAEPPVDQFPSAVLSPGEKIPQPVPRPTPDDLEKFVSAMPQQPEKKAVVSPREEATPTVAATPTAPEIRQEQPVQAIPESGVYVAGSGDNLSTIAERLGLTIDQILEWNPQIENPDEIAFAQAIVVDPEKAGVGGEISPSQPLEEENLALFNLYGVEVTPPSPEIGGYVVDPDFQQAYRGYQDVLGPPITRSEGHSQFFTYGVISRPYTRNVYYPGMKEQENEGPVRRDPVGWNLFMIRELENPRIREGDPGWPNPDEFQVDPRLLSLYQRLGGVKALGIAVSPLTEWNEREMAQWTTHGRLHLDRESGESWLAPLGEEYFEFLSGSNPELTNYRVNFEYGPEKVASIDSDLDLELKKRSEKVLNIFSQGRDQDQIDFRSEVFRDFWTVAYWLGEIDQHGSVVSMPMPSSETIYSILAKVELEFVRSPVVQEGAQRMAKSGAMKEINLLLREKVSGDYFFDGQVPQLPETKEGLLDSIIFAGGEEGVGGGLGFEYHPLLWGLKYSSRDLSSAEHDRVMRAFVNQYIHEAIHSYPQSRSREREGYDTYQYQFIHDLHSIPETIGEWITGVGRPEPSPQIIYVYGALKESGVKDPLGEMISSMATARFLVSYDRVRGEYLPMEVLFAEGDWLEFSPEAQKEIGRVYKQYRDEFMRAILKEHYNSS